jgi:hypothetical protein
VPLKPKSLKKKTTQWISVNSREEIERQLALEMLIDPMGLTIASSQVSPPSSAGCPNYAFLLL